MRTVDACGSCAWCVPRICGGINKTLRFTLAGFCNGSRSPAAAAYLVRAWMPGKRQAGWPSLWVTFLLATWPSKRKVTRPPQEDETLLSSKAGRTAKPNSKAEQQSRTAKPNSKAEQQSQTAKPNQSIATEVAPTGAAISAKQSPGLISVMFDRWGDDVTVTRCPENPRTIRPMRTVSRRSVTLASKSNARASHWNQRTR